MDSAPMSPDELSRAMQFLPSQQAASEARFDTRMEQLTHRMEQLTQKTDGVADGLIGLTAIVGRVVGTVSSLAEAQQRTDEQLRALAAEHRATESHLRTVESHLNVVIEMFERHLREDHGRQPS